MQSISSRIWTRVDMSISYDNNHCSTGTSFQNYNGGKKNKTKKTIMFIQVDALLLLLIVIAMIPPY